MLTRTAPDDLLPYLSDASNMAGGSVARVVSPESAEEVASVLAEASASGTPVTVSGAGTGIVGGRIPFGGLVLATDRLNRIGEIAKKPNGGGHGHAQSGVVLADYQRVVNAKGLFYPPDPTEWSCFLGGTVATNASGARTFKYGPTRNYVRSLEIALPTGQLIELKRGEIRASERGLIQILLPDGSILEAQLPTYQMPKTRKHASGYFIAPGMDAIDLFIGSEGTLGVITAVETELLDQPPGILSGVVFFAREPDLLEFVNEARARSLATRETKTLGVDARALEYFDARALDFLRGKFPNIPADAAGAIFFEQEITPESEDDLTGAWLTLTETHRALADDSWFATNERDQQALRDFRHALPVLVNEWLTHHGQRKVSTDMAVPDTEFPAMLRFYQDQLNAGDFSYVIFGHIGDNHVHVNILPKDDAEAARARELYAVFIRRAVNVGGTVSAEHGIGKLKRDYLRELYGDEHLREMARLKQALDPAGILGRGIMFDERLLETA
jgi:D-lactate dehydrogenase (cytochrome)